METYQRIFTQDYSEKLKREVNAGNSLNLYNCDNSPFEANSSNTILLTKVPKPEGLAEEMESHAKVNGNEDLEAAKALFKAYKDISPMLASHAPFWEYLSHIDLYKYMSKRWNKAQPESDNLVTYINDHWFYSARNGQWLSGLWWSVKISYREERENPFELTEELFCNQDWRSRTGGPSMIFRHAPAAEAIIEYVKNHKNDVFKTDFLYKSRYMMKYINRLGGARELMFFDKEAFTKILEAKSEDIKKSGKKASTNSQNKDIKKSLNPFKRNN